MGLFSDLKSKLADAKDTAHIKVLEAKLDREKKKELKFEKMKEDFLAQTAKEAHASGQPATVLENGQWYILYPDGRKEVMVTQSVGQQGVGQQPVSIDNLAKTG